MDHCQHDMDNEISVKNLCVSMVPIFSHLKNDEMIEVAKTSQSRTYQKGETVYESGDSSDYLYIVHKGQVKIYRLAESGKEQLLRIMGPGDFMGELALFTSDSLTDYAETMEKTEICAIHKTDIRRFLLVNPDISLKILAAFSSRLNEAEKTIERFSTQDAEKRIVSYLIDLANKKDTVQHPFEVTLPMSKRDLSSYIGMTQETLSRRLTSFQERGWIKLTGQRRILIVNFEAILDAAGE